MIRKFAAVFALLLGAGTIQAADLDGKLSAVDLKAGTITLPVEGKSQQFALAKDCKVYAKGNAGQRQMAYNLAAGGTAALAAGQTVTITTDFIDGQDTATMVKINSGVLGKPVQSVKPKKTPVPTPDSAKPDDKTANRHPEPARSSRGGGRGRSASSNDRRDGERRQGAAVSHSENGQLLSLHSRGWQEGPLAREARSRPQRPGRRRRRLQCDAHLRRRREEGRVDGQNHRRRADDAEQEEQLGSPPHPG